MRGQHVDLLFAVHRVPQVQARTQLQVTRLEHAFEQQDGAAPAQGAHARSLVQIQQGKTVGAAQAFEHTLDAMAVGVGLDDGPDTRVRRRLARARQVLPQGLGVDGGEYRTGHVGGFRRGGAILTPPGVL